jgi:hypothetical protein
MGLATVTVTLIYTDASGNLLKGKHIKYTPLRLFGDAGIIVPNVTVDVVTDPVTAEASVSLLTSDVAGAYVRYKVQFHNGNVRKFDLTDDQLSISLEDLINAFDGAQDPSAAVTLIDHETRLDILEATPPGAGAALTISAGTLSGTRASLVFADSNGVGFGLSGSTITASHNALTNAAAFRATSDNSQLRFTSADSQLQFTSANTNLLGTSATASFRHTSADSQLRFTSADSQLQFTSASSLFQATSDNSLLLGTGATASFRFTSQNSQLQFTSANSNLLGTAATASFRHTSADSQLRFTSADSQLRFTSADTQLQFTSANTKFVQEWGITGNTSGTLSSAQGSRLYFSGGANITLSGSSNTIVVSAAPPSTGGGAALTVSAGTLTGTRASLVFSDANAVSFGMSGSTITASIPGATSFSATGAVSISVNGSTISIGAPVQTNQTLGFYALGNTTQSSSGTFDARTMSVTAGGIVSAGFTGGSLEISGPASSIFRYTSADSQLQFTSANSDLLGTGATASFRFTSQNSQLRFTSADSQLQFTSAMSNYLGTAATQSFRHTSADTQLRFTSADSQLRFTSADTQLQFTSANTKFAQEWALTGNTAGTTSSVQGSRWYLSGGANLTISGNSNTLAFSAASQTIQTMGYYATGNTVQSSSGTQNATAGSLRGAGGISLGVSNGSIVVSGGPNLQYFELDDVQGMGLMTNLPAINTTPIFVPFILKGNLTNSSMFLQVSRATSGSNAFTVQAAIYSYVNATSISRLGSLQNVFSGGSTASMSGIRYLALSGWEAGVTAMTPGPYVLGLNFSAGATASMNYSLFGGQTVSAPVGFISGGTDQNATAPGTLGVINLWGRYTANSAAMPANVVQTDLVANYSGASQPLAPWFILRS